MRNKVLSVLFAALFPTLLLATPFAARADQKPRDLAMETYRFMDAAQGKSGGFLSKDASKANYFTQFASPAKAIVKKWPQPLTEEYYDYADCYFALDLLIKYGDKVIADKSQQDPELAVRKTRFGNSFRECQRDLRKPLQ
jgi:hypothetical protein